MTTAEEIRDEAVDSVKSAIKHISKIVVDQCHGHDDFSIAYRRVLRDSMQKLIEVREELK